MRSRRSSSSSSDTPGLDEQPERTSGADETERPIRCLRMVERTYWSGSISLAALSTSLATLPTAVRALPALLTEDIARLARHGLPITLCRERRCRVHALIPGFAIELTRAEASAVWAWCIVHGSVREDGGSDGASQNAEAVAVLRVALVQFHPGSGALLESDDPWSDIYGHGSTEPPPIVNASDLRSEARLVYRQLQIVDLVETRAAIDIPGLADELGVSERTTHGDLNTLRLAGIKLAFGRVRHEYVVERLVAHLSRRLTVPMAAALVKFLRVPAASDTTKSHFPQLRGACQKLIRGIFLSFAQQREELESLLAQERPGIPK